MNDSDTPTWDHVKRLFHAALEIPGEEREAFLRAECGDDPSVLQQVLSLLASHRSGDAHGSTQLSVPLAEKPGERIGAYKLLQVIGEGGFGTVFLAQQDAPVRRRVALKIIKLGMDTRQVIARFEAERQALALMDHPNIARVFDGGATDSGRPYFVMEYVTGDAITIFADARRLGVRDRLELFGQVCRAVQHAHTKGIIHRDLKPANVLVSMSDGRPFAKVIDFGIAKATGAAGGTLTEKTLFTEHRQLIGTPEYMSPEQAEGSPDIDTRTDVYALGVLLYELLTGLTPFDAKRLRSAAYAELQRIIREEEPPAPSLRLLRSPEGLASIAAARCEEPDRLGGVIRGELDWIVMKALDKDRGRRYESANQMAEDVSRHLAGEAVVAAPAGLLYQFTKVVRRRRAAVLAVAAVGLSLLFGLATTAWQWRDARRANADLLIERDSAQLESYVANLSLAQHAMTSHNWPEARQRLEACPPRKRGWEWSFLNLKAHAVLGVIRDERVVEFSSDSRHMLTVPLYGSWGHAVLRDRDGMQLAEFAHAKIIVVASFDPTGTRVLTASRDGVAQVWDLSGNRIGIPMHHDQGVTSAEFSPDGKLVLTSASQTWYSDPPGLTTRQELPITPDPEGVVCLWTSEGHLVRELRREHCEVMHAQFDSSGTRIITMSDNRVSLWGLDGIRIGDETTVGSYIPRVEGNRLLVVGDDGRTVQILNDVDLTVLREIKHANHIRDMVLAADETRVVTVDWEETLRVFDEEGRMVGDPVPYDDDLLEVSQINSDQQRLLLTSSSVAKMLSLSSGQVSDGVFSRAGGMSAPAFSPNGDRILTFTGFGVQVFDDDWRPLLELDFARWLDGEVDFARRAGWSDDGTITAIEIGGYSAIFDIAASSGSCERRVYGVAAYLEAEVALGRSLVSSTSSGTPRDELSQWPTASRPLAMATHPSGTPIVSATHDRLVRFWDRVGGNELAGIRVPANATALAFSPDGQQLVITLAGGSYLIWDTRSRADRQVALASRAVVRQRIGPAVGEMLAGPDPTEAISERLVENKALTALERLMALDVLEERARSIAGEAQLVFKQITLGQVEASAVRDAAASLDLPPRVKSQVISLAADWEPAVPSDQDAELAEQTRGRLLAEASLDYNRVQSERLNHINPPEAVETLRRVVSIREEYLGTTHAETIEAVWLLARTLRTQNEAEGDELIAEIGRRLDHADVAQDAGWGELCLEQALDYAGHYVGYKGPCDPFEPEAALEWIDRCARFLDGASDDEVRGMGLVVEDLFVAFADSFDNDRVLPSSEFRQKLRSIEASQLLSLGWKGNFGLGWLNTAEDWACVGENAEQLLAETPDDPYAMAALAGARYFNGAPWEAIELAERSIESRNAQGLPEDCMNAAIIAMSLFDLGRVDEGRAALERLRKLDRPWRDFYLRRAEELIDPELTADQQLRLAEAQVKVERLQGLSEYDEIITVDVATDWVHEIIAVREELLGPQHIETAKARWMLGDIEDDKGLASRDDTYEEAAQRLERSGRHPDVALAGQYLYHALDFAGQSDACRFQPETALKWIRRAADALDTFEESARLRDAPGLRGYVGPHAVRVLLNGDAGAAAPRDLARRLRNLTPSQLLAVCWWNEFQAFGRKWECVGVEAEDILTLEPDDPHALAALAGARYFAGDFDQALDLAQRARQERLKRGLPKDPIDRTLVAMALHQLGEVRESRAELDELRRDNHPRVERYLRHVEALIDPKPTAEQVLADEGRERRVAEAQRNYARWQAVLQGDHSYDPAVGVSEMKLALRAFEENLGAAAPETLDSLILLARLDDEPFTNFDRLHAAVSTLASSETPTIRELALRAALARAAAEIGDFGQAAAVCHELGRRCAEASAELFGWERLAEPGSKWMVRTYGFEVDRLFSGDPVDVRTRLAELLSKATPAGIRRRAVEEWGHRLAFYSSWAHDTHPGFPLEDGMWLHQLDRLLGILSVVDASDALLDRNQGLAHYRLGQYENALVALASSERLRDAEGIPPHPGTLAFLAMTYHQLQRPVEAQNALVECRGLLASDWLQTEALAIRAWGAQPVCMLTDSANEQELAVAIVREASELIENDVGTP